VFGCSYSKIEAFSCLEALIGTKKDQLHLCRASGFDRAASGRLCKLTDRATGRATSQRKPGNPNFTRPGTKVCL